MKLKQQIVSVLIVTLLSIGCGSPAIVRPEVNITPEQQSQVTRSQAESSPEQLKSPTPVLSPAIENPTPPAMGTPDAGSLSSKFKVVFSENTHDGSYRFWLADPAGPASPTLLTIVSGFSDFGMKTTLSPDNQRITFTALAQGAPDNRFIAELWVMKIDGGEQKLLAQGVDIGGYPDYPLWSPDSGSIIFLSQSGTGPSYEQKVWLVGVETGEKILLMQTDQNNFILPLGWTKDGSSFFYRQSGEGTSDIYKFSLKDKAANFVVSIPILAKICRLSPDTTQLLCDVLVDRQTRRHDLMVIPLDGEKPVVVSRRTVEDRQDNFAVVWRPAGQSITLNTAPTENGGLRLIDRNSLAAATLAPLSSGVYVPRSWSPDGVWLAAQDISEIGDDLYFFSDDGSSVNQLTVQGAVELAGWLPSHFAR